MYQAELNGKISSKLDNLEDILTSNVFSFFKYSDRSIYLFNYLLNLNLEVTVNDVNNAQFIFWPKFIDGTEPDLVIIAGIYYILVEAKYFSNFSDATNKIDSQINREIEMGLQEASNQNLNFIYLTVTADYFYKKEKFNIINSTQKKYHIWTNWQSISTFLYQKLFIDKMQQNLYFALDLYLLLEKKKLIKFDLKNLNQFNSQIEDRNEIFFNFKKSKFRGHFIGFINSLNDTNTINKITNDKTIFFNSIKKHFSSLEDIGVIRNFTNNIFFSGEFYG